MQLRQTGRPVQRRSARTDASSRLKPRYSFIKTLGTELVLFWFLGVLSLAAGEADPFPHAEDSFPCADRVIEGVLLRFPSEPVLISGSIEVRRRHGVVVQELGFSIRLDMSASPPEGSYLIMGVDGTALERLDVARPGRGRLRKRYFAGAELKEAEAPNLLGSVQGTDLTWTDLTLGFLWWKNPVITGLDTVRGRECFVVEIPVPEGEDSDCAKVVLWVEKNLLVVLQAEAQDARGAPLRRLWIRSLKKINDRWMIKDMEAQRFPSSSRTRISVFDMLSDSEI